MLNQKPMLLSRVGKSLVELAWTDAARQAAAEARRNYAQSLRQKLGSGYTEEKGQDTHIVQANLGFGHALHDTSPMHKVIESLGFEKKQSTPRSTVFKHSDGTTLTHKTSKALGGTFHTFTLKSEKPV